MRAAIRCLVPALAAALLLAGGRARADAEETARRVVHLVEYVARDYPLAVRDGAVVDAFEYEEQGSLIAQARDQLGALGVAPADPLAGALGRIDAAVQAKQPADAVASEVHALAAALRERFSVRALPPRTPSPDTGGALYAQACASCHGTAGRGDGPAGRGLEPAPADLGNRSRMQALSPFAIYNMVSFGIDGTAMASLADRFDEGQRWDLAFFAASLAASPELRERGRALVAGDPERIAARVPSLAALVDAAPSALAAGDAEIEAAVAYLHQHPEALRGRELPLAVARTRLEASWAAYGAGESRRAVDLAISAYLDGFEQVEPALATVDPALRVDAETGFLRYREALRAGRPVAEIEPLHRGLVEALARAESRLAGGSLGPRAVFLSALTILAREGLEAVLLVVAIAGVLGRAGRRDALPWVHAGWIGALVAGAATWWAAGRLVDISGARREVIEGASALLAAAILFWVSYWLISKVEAARWQTFLDGRIRSALSRGSLGALAGVSFVAVYRECFETVLFYQALAAQAGPGGAQSIAAGIGAGVALLAVLALAIFRFGRRLSMRRFFAASSLLLYALAIVLAGQGIAAFQEAGLLRATWLPLPRVEWLGLHPTAEGLGLQVALALAALLALPKLLGGMRGAAVPAAGRAAPGPPGHRNAGSRESSAGGG